MHTEMPYRAQFATCTFALDSRHAYKLDISTPQIGGFRAEEVLTVHLGATNEIFVNVGSRWLSLKRFTV